MEIRQLEIDFDKRILRVNGEDYHDGIMIVNLPGPEGWPISMLINGERATGAPEDYSELTVYYQVYP